jgi:hypothetical protein
MKVLRILFAALIVICVVEVAAAQQAREWVPQGVEALREGAASKVEFTLDHGMLIFAAKLDSDNEDFRRVIAGVSGVSVHSFRYPGRPWMYDPEAVNSVAAEYQAAGWKRLMNRHAKDGGPGESELWIRFDHNAVSNVAILLARSNEVNFIVVSGSISPLDLSHLGGHFGIPKIEGGVLVPNEERR